ncbi:hypothetical protein BVRB_8g193770 [Beta vulgaris subsp. vulgaris]|nr:hypothetical protein BVRB_8g193770 [Beta vulgaris subsp. vulgaris]
MVKLKKFEISLFSKMCVNGGRRNCMGGFIMVHWFR